MAVTDLHTSYIIKKLTVENESLAVYNLWRDIDIF